jgi:type I restriction enzyme S subunit
MNDACPTTLGRYIHVKHGFAFKGEYFTDEVTPDVLVTPGNFAIGGGFQGNKLKYYAGPVPDDYLLQSGDLVVTMTDLSKAGDTLGYPALIPESAGIRYLHNQRVGLIEIKHNAEADKRFLFYRLRADDYRHHILATATGSTVRHTSPGRICEFETTLPPIDEQRAIAGVLGALDDKIEQNRQTSRALERLGRAIFRAWFVDFEPVKAKAAGATAFTSMPQPAFDALPTRFVNSNLGQIPDGWEVKTVEECVHLTMGQSPPSEFYNEDGEGLPFHQGVSNFGLRFPTHRVYCTVDARLAEPRDVMLSVRAPVGRINVADRRLILGRGLAGLRHHQQRQTFLLYQLYHLFAEEDAVGEGTIYKAVTKKFLAQMQMLSPARSIVEAFDALVSPFDDLITAFETESRNLNEMRDSLLPELLSGKVRVVANDV